jgi:hypothetical protein
MPLFDNAIEGIRNNLEQIRNGKKAPLIAIGILTKAQLSAINGSRLKQGLSTVIAEVLFVGRHIYQSRIVCDGYTIDDVLDQISHAMESVSVVLVNARMTAIENPTARADRYGNLVKDRAILECSTRHPRPELFSVIPKGDIIKPK